ncbi:hypothetical protein NRK68_21530 [Streptomyces yangpuensis]|uniref:Secreted protein n=1 Tax=Streptomyces yangpuensis TaxID=1648182 RepID=A0ABY5Q0Q1_9ACTN|nr:hypothetical protein [Streptomyces yangpuensis]UUY49573.1 hypothetical protein NRK68_21530 [Streptomyces yangpuensis]
MIVRHAGRGNLAVGMMAILTLALTGCGGEGKSDKPGASTSAKPQAGGEASPSGAGKSETAPTQVLATVNGESGMVLTINKAARDAGGFLTIEGQLKNNGTAPYVNTAPWRGNELNASGVSVAGVTLVDKAGKKRYYVLRDTDGRCLCTTGLNIIEANQTMPFFAQFPAPPSSTAEVDLSLPTFATATVKLSG